jgi:hypothetical protein
VKLKGEIPLTQTSSSAMGKTVGKAIGKTAHLALLSLNSGDLKQTLLYLPEQRNIRSKSNSEWEQ